MSFFDFSGEVERAICEAKDEVSRLSARTAIARARFPNAVVGAGFSLLSRGEPFSPSAYHHALVIGVATWSDPDLAALENLAKDSCSRDVEVIVFDIDDWPLKDILQALPGASTFTSTPVVTQYRDGVLRFQGQGPDAIRWLDQF
jgi:hypothetical protein